MGKGERQQSWVLELEELEFEEERVENSYRNIAILVKESKSDKERGFLESGGACFLKRKSKNLRHILVTTFSLPDYRC